MLSKKILCGVVAYTTLASCSVGAYAAGGIEPKDIPSVIVNNPLLSAGAFAAVTTAILTYKILAKSYGKETPLENSKDEKVKKNLHEDLPDSEKTAKVEDPEKGSDEIKEEPVNVSKENENNLDGFNLDFFRNKIEKWHVYTGIGVIVTAVIIYLIHKRIKEAPYKKAFEKLKEVWAVCCKNLKNFCIEVDGTRFNSNMAFRALVDLRKDQQGNPVFVFGKRKIELKLSGGKIIKIDKSGKNEKIYDFDLKDLMRYVRFVSGHHNEVLEKSGLLSDNEENLIKEDFEDNKALKDKEWRKLILGVGEYDYREFLIENEDTPKSAFNKLVGLWKKICKDLEDTEISIKGHSLNGKKVFRAYVDLREDENGNPLLVFSGGVQELLLAGERVICRENEKNEKKDVSVEMLQYDVIWIDNIGANLGSGDFNEIKDKLKLLSDLLVRLEEYDGKVKKVDKNIHTEGNNVSDPQII